MLVKTDGLFRTDSGAGDDDDAFWAETQECKICSVVMWPSTRTSQPTSTVTFLYRLHGVATHKALLIPAP
jgi:hypothetical protein